MYVIVVYLVMYLAVKLDKDVVGITRRLLIAGHHVVQNFTGGNQVLIRQFGPFPGVRETAA